MPGCPLKGQPGVICLTGQARNNECQLSFPVTSQDFCQSVGRKKFFPEKNSIWNGQLYEDNRLSWIRLTFNHRILSLSPEHNPNLLKWPRFESHDTLWYMYYIVCLRLSTSAVKLEIARKCFELGVFALGWSAIIRSQETTIFFVLPEDW